MGLAACSSGGPVPIAYDRDACDFCRMQISDPRYGGEAITRTGKVLKFDSIECLASYYTGLADRASVRSLWVSDYQRPGTLIPATDARFVHHSGPGSPMGRGLLATAMDSDADALAERLGGAALAWTDVLTLVQRDAPHADGDTARGDTRRPSYAEVPHVH
jgi:copper chaperone NosL